MFLTSWLVVVNLVTFAAYHLDKNAAISHKRRTPEITLLILGVLGGWPAAILAQRTLRHKTRKIAFQIVFWITIIINIFFLMWLSAHR